MPLNTYVGGVKIITKSSVEGLKFFVRLNQKFTWTWDTFAEPNIENNTERKLSNKIRLHHEADISLHGLAQKAG